MPPPVPDNLPVLYRPAQIADVLGCPEWWVKEQARHRRIPFTRLGGSYRFTAGHLAEIIRIFEERRSSRPTPTPCPPPGRRTDPPAPRPSPPDHGSTPDRHGGGGHPQDPRPPPRKEPDMGYGEKRGDYWRARYKVAPGKYRTLADANGEVLRFRTKRAAEQAADEEEAKVRGGRWHDPAAARITFGEYANRWYAVQDLAASTMQNYRRHIEEHLLPHFNDLEVGEINRHHVEQWERQERGRGYAAASIKTWRSTLHLLLGDAVDDGLRETNTAARRRGRGKRAGRSRNRGPEKVITDALGILLIAERAVLLTGRDDEFVALVTKGYTGIRWGELMGLEAQFIRPGALRVEWQLYELDGGEFHRCPPKDDSYRTIDTPDFLTGLLTRHISTKRPEPCACHGLRYAFNGYSAANGAARRPGAKLVDVARKAGVSAGTVSNVLNRPETVSPGNRARVEAAVAELGYVRNASSRELAAHWRRSGFASWLFYPATTGSYPTRAPRDAHPVPLIAEPWPGVPARGRGAAQRAQACWVPIAPGLTPHGLRHTHRTIMEEAGTSPKLMDERLGHEDGSVQARYSHVTPRMRARLIDALTEQWGRTPSKPAAR